MFVFWFGFEGRSQPTSQLTNQPTHQPTNPTRQQPANQPDNPAPTTNQLSSGKEPTIRPTSPTQPTQPIVVVQLTHCCFLAGPVTTCGSTRPDSDHHKGGQEEVVQTVSISRANKGLASLGKEPTSRLECVRQFLRSLFGVAQSTNQASKQPKNMDKPINNRCLHMIKQGLAQAGAGVFAATQMCQKWRDSSVVVTCPDLAEAF